VIVIDASAALAFLQGEPGFERVRDALADAVIGAVNFSEILAKLAEKGVGKEAVGLAVSALACPVIDFDRAQAEASADLRPASRKFGLSLADRACLALAKLRGATALTADKVWADLDLGIEIEVIR